MKKVGADQGYVDLGTQDAKAGIDPMGRGEPIVVDKRVKQGTPDRTVTFTGRAADEYHRVTSLGWRPDEAYEHANAIQKQIDASVEAGIQHDGDDTMGKYVEQQRVLSEEFIDYKPPGVFPEDHLPGPQLAQPTKDLGDVIEAKRQEIVAKDPSLAPYFTPAVVDSDTEIDMINHPPHYTNHPSGIEPIEICRWMMFDVGNAVKYMIRSDLKGSPRDDADKARFYLVDALEQTNARIWGIPTNQHECVQAQEKLVLVAEKEPDFVKAMLFHALAEDNVPRALSAARELLARHA